MSSTATALRSLFAELVDGPEDRGDAYMLNSGDVGLLRSLDHIDADAASLASNAGATIAAHAEHVRYGLSLMNRWARHGGNPFGDARWDEAWKIARVDTAQWQEIRSGLRDEAAAWGKALAAPRDVNDVELKGLIASVAHLAYHLGAVRQIVKETRGPRDASV